MSAQILPVTSAPNQFMTVGLALNGGTVALSLQFSYNRVGGFWVMDVSDLQGNPLVTSIPLLTGDWPAANIMAPFDYLQIGAWYVINQSGAIMDWPDSNTLGAAFLVLVDDNPAN